jgi:hypothetical protein
MNYKHRITGRIITEAQYAVVSGWDQNDWYPMREHTIVDTAIDIGVGMILGDMLFGDSPSIDNTPDSSSFDGFGGGDFGGSGTGGDW